MRVIYIARQSGRVLGEDIERAILSATMNPSEDTLEVLREVQELYENKQEYISNYKPRAKKGKQIKNWQKNNFWE